jgi:hypothetical protein
MRSIHIEFWMCNNYYQHVDRLHIVRELDFICIMLQSLWGLGLLLAVCIIWLWVDPRSKSI